MLAAVALAAGWLGYHRAWGEGAAHTVAHRTIHLPGDRVRERAYAQLLASPADVRAATGGEAEVDPERSTAVLVVLGPRSSSGYSVRAEVVEQRRRMLVRIGQDAPRLGDETRPGVTYPAAVVTFERTGKPVELEW